MTIIFIIVVAEFDQQGTHLFTVISGLRRSWKKADIATIHEFMQSIMDNVIVKVRKHKHGRRHQLELFSGGRSTSNFSACVTRPGAQPPNGPS